MMRAFQDIPQLQEEIEDTEYTITLVYHAIAENIAKNEKKTMKKSKQFIWPKTCIPSLESWDKGIHFDS